MIRIGWALVIAAVAVGAAGCVEQDRFEGRRGSPLRLPDPTGQATTPDVDEALLVALGQAKNFHAKAQVYRDDGQAARAIDAVRQVLTVTFPAGAPEGEDVRQDARALLGQLLAAAGRLDEAEAVVDEGLAGTPRASFFLANLYTVRGELHQLRAAAAADPASASASRRAAIVALDRSIAINLEIQARLSGAQAP